ncbi:hypothetical protein AAVH_35878 [Aphelenchoides avenae]|nr:hypothetical protein AAVH_35878 [Aphelenchus avenae]
MSAFKLEKGPHAPDFSDAENEAIIKHHFDRRHILEGKHSSGVSQKAKQAAWQEILNAVNAISTTGTRTLEQLKNRQRKMFNSWKSYKTQLAHPPTGGGPPPAVKPFYSTLDDLYAEDCRVTGVMGNGIEIGTSASLVPAIDTSTQILFETQLTQTATAPTLASEARSVSDDEEINVDDPNFSVWRDKPKPPSRKPSSSSSTVSLASNTFATPSLRKALPVAKRRLTYDEVPTGVGKQEENAMKCLELQKKILLQTQAKLEKELINEDLRHVVLKKQRRLIDLQLHREECVQRQMGILDEEEMLNRQYFEAIEAKNSVQYEEEEEDESPDGLDEKVVVA